MEKRLDILVCEHLSVSREYAKEVILSGKCMVNGKVVIKSGVKFSSDCRLEIFAEKLPYVSRGGLKLAHAMKEFDIDIIDKVCIDIGASTGGFTDCMLQHGAKSVIALDNGHGQLAEKLLHDPRVISMENTNIMTVNTDELAFTPEFASVDLSFISLEKVISKVASLLDSQSLIVFLVKPQFECGANALSKKGVVNSLSAHRFAIDKIVRAMLNSRLVICDMDFSPIMGQNGNTEYLFLAEKRG
ncbi:MAG: TlyA family RNA methyltransferase [Defluviitaleaceae bacterium]|nr:TlyA family RNA methyltransferase [Defluviitaleaceae bacterium]